MIHSYDCNVAKKYGIISAVILYYIYGWIKHNSANNINYRDGYYWTYNSVQAYKTQFPELSSDQVRRALEKLRNDGILITGNYNASPYDRTMWYTISEAGYRMISESISVEAEAANQMAEEASKAVPDNPEENTTKEETIRQNCQMKTASTTNENGMSAEPIPKNLNIKLNNILSPLEKERAREERKKFVKPTVEEVAAYCSERHNNIDPENFCDFYEANGWKVGKNPMKDWRAAVRTWEKRQSSSSPQNSNRPGNSDVFSEILDEEIQKIREERL